jgi:hypothetical protein
MPKITGTDNKKGVVFANNSRGVRGFKYSLAF